MKDMKLRLILSAIAFLLTTFASTAQTQQKAQKPVIMVVPEKAWCINQGYQLADVRSADYERALRNNDISNVITRMGDIMAQRGYPLKLLSATLDELQNEAALDMGLQSKGDGEIVEDNLDQLLRVAGADIVVNIAFTRTTAGPRGRIEFRVTSVDAATSKQIGGNVGQSSASSAPMASLLEECVLGFIDNFSASIQRHFDDVIKNGREGTIIFKIASDSPLHFDSDVTLNGETGTLAEAIDYYLAEHALRDNYTQGGKSRVRLSFEQVRFPLYGKARFGNRQRAINAEGFISPIGSFLSQFGLSVSTTPIGIGKVYVVIGHK